MKIQKKSKKYLIVSAYLLIIILTVFIQFIVLSHKYKNQSTLLIREIEDSKQKYKLLEDNIRLINENSNEVRNILSLPESHITLSNSKSGTISSKEKNDNIAFFNAVDYIKIYSYKVRMQKDLYTLLNSENVNSYFTGKKLHLKKTGSSTYELLKSNNNYFKISTNNPKSPSIIIESFLNNKKQFPLKETVGNNVLLFDFIDTSLQSIDQHYSQYNILTRKFMGIAKDKSLQNYIKKEKLEISGPSDEPDKSYYIISNKDKSFSIKISLNLLSLDFNIGTKKYITYSDFYNALIPFLENSDKRTKEIKVVDTAKLKVKSVLGEESFIAYLTQNNLAIDQNPREDNDYFYFDIKSENGNHIGSFAVQKILGNVYLMDSEDIMISSLKFLETLNTDNTQVNIKIPENLPQITDRYSTKDSTTFVVIGSHENNADTIILVHANEITREITLIAVPRDLYYKGDKINDYYRSYGGEKFTDILTDITGLNITGYIAVDMYAFIDIINILGGIDITLESDLVDPTYMVRDNGEWSTLYYKKGTHHLNGIESLRIARSRHTSSDFGRTSRQQLVIQGIKDKLSTLDITDLATVLKLFQTLDKYLDTNFSPMEMLSLYMKYRTNNLNRKQGLSTFNVLYNTYTNIYKLKDKSKQYEEGFYRGSWILLPRKDDWNVIKWYIRNLIEDNQS